jgi:hypothetical protein
MFDAFGRPQLLGVRGFLELRQASMSRARSVPRKTIHFLMALPLVIVAALITLIRPGAGDPPEAVGTADVRKTTVLLPSDGETPTGQPSFTATVPEVVDATDAAELSVGWVVLDRRTPQLAFLDDAGRLLTRVSRKGDGPGELVRPAAIAVVGSTLAVIDVAGTRFDFFELDGVFRERLRVAAGGCATTQLHRVAATSTGFAMLRGCTHTDGSVSALAEWVGLDGERELIQNPVYMNLKRGTLRLMNPILTVVGDRVYLGLTPDACIESVTRGQTERERLCHPDTNPQFFPDSIRKQLARDMSDLPSGVTFEVPDRLPAFDDILAVGDAVAFHVVRPDSTDAIEVVRDGKLERIVPVPGNRFFFGKRGVLVAQERPDGTAFAVLPLP